MDHLEIYAVVIGVALYAGGARRAGAGKGRVEAAILLQLAGDLTMTIEALERWFPRGNLVTLNAVGIAAQTLVRFCQRARRDLGRCAQGESDDRKSDQSRNNAAGSK